MNKKLGPPFKPTGDKQRTRQVQLSDNEVLTLPCPELTINERVRLLITRHAAANEQAKVIVDKLKSLTRKA